MTGTAWAAPDVPVPSTPTTAPVFIGTPAKAQPVKGVPKTPQNPHLAANGDSSIHNDGWQTDTYRRSGPLGKDPETFSAAINGVCGSITYDTRGRIVSTCVGVQRALNLIDPDTMDVIATYPLPGPPPGSQASNNPLQELRRRGPQLGPARNRRDHLVRHDEERRGRPLPVTPAWVGV